MKKEWKVSEPDKATVSRLSMAVNCSKLLSVLLVNRGIETKKEAIKFLYPSFAHVRAPFSMKGMDAAVRRIYQAITNNEKILIFGDYDVDGVTSTALLTEFLQSIDAKVDYYIPHRTKEGYSIQPEHILDLAKPAGISLIITVDCGSGSYEAANIAAENNIDLIITDHHNLSEELPPAYSVINPKRSDCEIGLENLAGVGVAYCLLISLRKFMRDNRFWSDKPEPNLKQSCDLVALGTVADMVPLKNENRVFSKTGLDAIRTGCRPGINALAEASGISLENLDSEDISFRLGPRLNAAGRLSHASLCVKLLLEKNREKATRRALNLSHMNLHRQETERAALKEITSYIKENPGVLTKNTIVLSHHGWHEGIIGIIASRLAKQYYRPTVLISTASGVGKGSARSIPGLDIYRAFSLCANDLEDFGGHSMAAGLKIKPEKIEHFSTDFEKAVSNMTTQDDYLPIVSIDAMLSFSDISDRLLNDLETLKPFGQGNPEPLFMAYDIEILSSRIVGKNHRRMVLQQKSNRIDKRINAIQFNIDPDKELPDRFEKMAFRLQWNRWNRKKTIQILVEEI